MFCSTEKTDPAPASFTNTWIGDNSRVSLTYLIYRWFLAIFFTASLVQSILQSVLHFLDVEQTENVYKYFIYLTNNGRLVAALAFTLEASLVTRRWRREREARTAEDSERSRLSLGHKISWILNNINSSISVLISLVYWTALYTPEKVLDFQNFSGHLLICLSCLVDVWVSDRPWRLSHALHPILYGSVFGVFSLAYHFLQGRNYHFEPYIYHILDWNKPTRTSLVICGVCLSLVVFHFSFYLMFRLRRLVSEGGRRWIPAGSMIAQEEA